MPKISQATLPFTFGLKQNKALSSASTDFIQNKYEIQGLKKVHYGSQRQVDFLARQVTFKAHVSNVQGTRQVIL